MLSKMVFAALLSQAAPSLNTPGIILVLSSDTAFVTPTHTIGREGTIRRADLVEIYPLGSEQWEIVRRDTALAFECSSGRFRVLSVSEYDADGGLRRSDEPDSEEWSTLPDFYPPITMLQALACGEEDLSAAAHHSLERELSRLRERLK